MTSRARVSRVTNALALLACFVIASVAQATEPTYPSRPIRLVFGFPPGGGGDFMARIIAPKLGDSMGQNWIVDNRPGAAGNLSTEIVARANPDGHTVLLALDSQLTVNPTLYKLPFSVDKDLHPIAMLATVELVLAVHPGVQAMTLKEFIALAKLKPDALNYASCGVGCSTHLIVELLKKRTGIGMVHVPYKGSVPAAAAMVAGETQVMVGSVPAMIGFITAGRVRALAITGAKRSKVLPEVPTVAESGYPGFDVISWYSLLVPSATPKSIKERIRNDTLKALQHPEVQAGVARLGMNSESGTPEELVARIRKETATWAGIIKDAGIRAE